MSLNAAFAASLFTPRMLRLALRGQQPCSRRPRVARARVFACAPKDMGGDAGGFDIGGGDIGLDVNTDASIGVTDTNGISIESEAPLDASMKTPIDAPKDVPTDDETDTGKEVESAPAVVAAEPLFADASAGDMGFGPSASIYDSGDEIDRSNRTFGMYNKLTKRDLLLGKSVVVPGVGKEKPLKMFYREAVPTGPYNTSSAVLLLSGLPASSYSYREVLPLLAKAGHRAVAPDFIGFGLSDKPSPDYEFDYTSEAFIDSLRALLAAIGVSHVTLLVSQGWLATNGLLFALRNADVVGAICTLNSPLPPARPRLPSAMARWALPGFLGNAFAQDALSVEKTVEGGSRYALALEDADVYRRPAMLTGDTGFALAAASRRLDMPNAYDELERDFSGFPNPVAVVSGADDRYLPNSVGEGFKKDVCPQAEISVLDGAGHFAQEDFGERVAAFLIAFIKKHDLGSARAPQD